MKKRGGHSKRGETAHDQLRPVQIESAIRRQFRKANIEKVLVKVPQVLTLAMSRLRNVRAVGKERP